MKVISRNSKLALIQVNECFNLYPEINYELIPVASFGDKRKDISLLENPPKDIFTRELDDALLTGDADVAVHSAKDLPYPLPLGLEVIALLKEFDQTDALVSNSNLKLENLPLGAKIGTSSPTREKEVIEIRPDLQIVSIRGTIEERISLVDNGTIDALIVATCALKRLQLSHRISEVLPFQTHPLQGLLAVVATVNRTDLRKTFSKNDIRTTYGEVTLVGFGPGNPDLLTIGGQKALAQADIIFHDDLLDRTFIDNYTAELVYVGKRKGKHSAEQESINRLLLEAAKTGKNVVRLKGGDPMIFAHGGEEIEFLRSNFVEVNVIPGITTALALSAITKVPLTHRSIASSVTFISGHEAMLKFPDSDTIVCYMAGFNIPEIASKAISLGRNPHTPVLLVSNVSKQNQKEFFHTLDSLSKETNPFPTPVISIIGDVVALRYKSEKELQKPQYLYTGSELPIENNDIKITHQPLIELIELEDKTEVFTQINNLKYFEWIVFTSRFAVKFFFESLNLLNKDTRCLSGLKIASIGKTTTNALKNKGLRPDLESEEDTSYGLIEKFKNLKATSAKILIPRSELALSILPVGLLKLGFEVTSLITYKNRLPQNLKPLNLELFKGIIFTSPSCVTNFIEVYGKIPADKKIITRGRVTQERLDECLKKQEKILSV